MESRDIFIEIYREKIESSFPSLESVGVVANVVVEVIGSLRGERSDLFIASSVTGNKENRDTFDLENISLLQLRTIAGLPSYLRQSLALCRDITSIY